jgi:hypothetical protein
MRVGDHLETISLSLALLYLLVEVTVREAYGVKIRVPRSIGEAVLSGRRMEGQGGFLAERAVRWGTLQDPQVLIPRMYRTVHCMYLCKCMCL